ncbi:GNAT family N-acetyltransferase [uncultured Adlercreutzia sp.]|uniref:GNAT family N-acetyltransferase n=1 Tax=uncultured Adlercreutzia sp. TaxID=875803 RepID=UPI0026F3B9FD|nr:GNAT family N-acetyltransferase [uncultured Adlercreutzia sp.]
MSVSFRQVERDEEVETLAHMARVIWNEYWPALIGQEQTDYMVDKFQSLNAFRTDIADNGYEYFFIMEHEDETPRELDQAAHGADVHDKDDSVPAAANDAIESSRDGELARDAEGFARTASAGRIVGYTGGHVEPETNRFFISKIYLLKEHRGRGLCSATLRFYETLARRRGLGALYLTVNKHNELGIRAYKGNGFEVIDSVETDIGEGFVMDDYIMEKKLH